MAQWFADNQMKKHKYKFHAIISGNENITIHVDANITEKNICEKLLAINFVYKPKFKEHLDSILKKSGLKVKRILMNSFFSSDFNYCPLVWMFQS